MCEKGGLSGDRNSLYCALLLLALARLLAAPLMLTLAREGWYDEDPECTMDESHRCGEGGGCMLLLLLLLPWAEEWSLMLSWRLRGRGVALVLPVVLSDAE